MTGYQKHRLELSKISAFPDIDLEAILAAISLARTQLSDHSSYEDIVAQAIANLPDGLTSFERGVVSGIVVAQIQS